MDKSVEEYVKQITGTDAYSVMDIVLMIK